jgi:tetratricopeptide (TPR) repeat protein
MAPIGYFYLAAIHSAGGDLQSGRECAEEALRLSQEFNGKAMEGLAWMALGSIEWKADPTHIDVAEADIRKGSSILEEQKLRAYSAQGYLFLGELLVDGGNRDAALESLKKAEALYLEMRVIPQSHWLGRAQEAMGRVEAGSKAT